MHRCTLAVLVRNKLYMFKETYGLSPVTKLEKVVIPTAPMNSGINLIPCQLNGQIY